MNDWETTHGALEKTFKFFNFTEALSFVNKVGEVAESMEHHPDISLHDYKLVTIRTITHDTESVTEKDHALAKAIDAIS